MIVMPDANLEQTANAFLGAKIWRKDLSVAWLFLVHSL